MHSKISSMHMRTLCKTLLFWIKIKVEKADDEANIKRNEIGMITRKLHMMEIIECADKNDYSALSEASAGGNVETIKFLIEKGLW